ncbi:amidohydrolase [Arthrobacter sp. ERGS1:01]|uniref:amidohydrolase n=1 Tax=Arthrobacter sp. ERGS1:01 TaxID=1704044 RepID=UPI0006B589C9|nr:amidohydrolase [Arthrobacter sp. ERGS1:01]ALE06025.1 amidohydrolase [Arthrobacter sp. ERGS1:01]
MPFADVLFTGGAVFTGIGIPVRGQAVAIVGERIAGIFPESESGAWIGEHTRIVDLDGGLLSPGFQDGHIHPVSGGVELLMCNLSEAVNAAEAVATVQEYAAAHPEEPWILGGGWSMDHFPGGSPLRTLLDDVVPDRPVLLQSRDHHSTWANTAAIQLAGIEATTADPADGRIEREADGTPAGTFHEGAGELFSDVRPPTDPDFAYLGLLRAQQELIALGITGWQDAMVGGGSGDACAVYERAVAEGTLRVHVVGAQWWERTGGIEQVGLMVDRRDALAARGDSDRFSLGTAKIMVDGVAENHTASMLTPYRDEHGRDTCNHGLSFIDESRLTDYVVALDDAGLQVHFHALGDRAVRNALNAIEAARLANGPSDGRHQLAHLQVVEEADTGRFAPLDAIANIQSLWACHEDQLDELTLPFLQEGAEARQYPFGDLVRHGARLAAGSDWPVSSANPIDAIHIAVNRVSPGSSAEPLGGGHQRLALETAMAAYTSGTAYANHRDHDTGYVREGYLANVVVLQPDPFTLAPEEIHRATVASTWIEGDLAYSRSA